MRILGIDPGSHATGYGVIERQGNLLRHVAHGTLRPRGASPEMRLHDLYRLLCEVVGHHEPDVAAVERVFVAQNARSALVLGQARGVALAACALAGLPTGEYTPAQVKVAVTGYGRAEKLQVMKMVQRLLGLVAPPPSDEADALAVAVCHGLSLRSPLRRTSARGPIWDRA